MSDEQRILRDALGAFATGVTVVTAVTTPDSNAQSEKSTAIGVTINSFNTVSLEPPLVLWSLASKSKNLAYFAPGRPHNIHVLAREQETLALHFADSRADKFSSLDYQLNAAGVPLLPGCVAHFECRTEAWHAGGDHIVIIARLERFTVFEGDPLLFYRGQFESVRRQLPNK